MDQIIEQMILLNEKDWLDIIGTILPILLTVVIIVQNIVFSYRTDKLEKYIYNRDQVNRYHDDILKELYGIVEDRFELAKKIIDKYLNYINNGKLFQVSENAWRRIISQDQTNSIFKYNYVWLASDKNLYDDFIKLCQSEELKEIQELLKEYHEKHSYDNFDRYFESFLSLDKI